MTDERLSPHFTLGELLRSDVAARHPEILAKQQHPSADVVDALRRLCETTLEPLRELLDFPLRVTSGYRCASLNKLVGGSRTSQHLLGEAADVEIDDAWLRTTRGQFLARAVTSDFGDVASGWSANGVLYAVVAESLEYLDVDQVIHEGGLRVGQPAWVHVASSSRQSRRRVTFWGPYTRGRYVDRALPSAIWSWGRSG